VRLPRQYVDAPEKGRQGVVCQNARTELVNHGMEDLLAAQSAVLWRQIGHSSLILLGRLILAGRSGNLR